MPLPIDVPPSGDAAIDAALAAVCAGRADATTQEVAAQLPTSI